MSSVYTTVLGDTWDAIAYAQYGDTKYTEQLMAANQDADLLAIVVFDAGTALTIPDVDTADSTGVDDSNPPWRQSS